MSVNDRNIDELKQWHYLRRKALTQEPLTDKEYRMLGRLMAFCEGKVFPSLRQIENYRRWLVQVSYCSSEAVSAIEVYADNLADFEKMFVDPNKKIHR